MLYWFLFMLDNVLNQLSPSFIFCHLLKELSPSWTSHLFCSSIISPILGPFTSTIWQSFFSTYQNTRPQLDAGHFLWQRILSTVPQPQTLAWPPLLSLRSPNSSLLGGCPWSPLPWGSVSFQQSTASPALRALLQYLPTLAQLLCMLVHVPTALQALHGTPLISWSL